MVRKKKKGNHQTEKLSEGRKNASNSKKNIQRASTRTEKYTKFFGINANSSTPEYEPAKELCKLFGE